jgi:hypothetical protein
MAVTCCQCATIKAVKPDFNKRLVNLVGDVDLLSRLAKLGIFLDQHLDALLDFKHDHLMKFFTDVVSNQMTPLAKLRLIKSLQVESLNIRERQTPHLVLIPCPPFQLCDLYQHKDLFQKATKLEDNDFEELMVRSGLFYIGCY